MYQPNLFHLYSNFITFYTHIQVYYWRKSLYISIICRHETEHWHIFKKTDLSKVVYKRSKMKMKITLPNYKLS